jgi:hypothetical protein
VAENGSDFIAYLFASVPGISDIGTYTGNGGVQIIDCGFDDTSQSVVGLLVKRVDGTGDWGWHHTWDGNQYLGARFNLNDTSASQRHYDLEPGWGGFRVQPASPYNIDGAEYIYYAISAV